MESFTYYDLWLIDVQNPKAIIAEFRAICEDAKDAISEDGDSRGDVKWYTDKDDLCKFSKSYPEVLFVLQGEGEIREDIWRLYVKNGKSFLSKAEIVFPEYKEEYLA